MWHRLSIIYQQTILKAQENIHRLNYFLNIDIKLYSSAKDSKMWKLINKNLRILLTYQRTCEDHPEATKNGWKTLQKQIKTNRTHELQNFLIAWCMVLIK